MKNTATAPYVVLRAYSGQARGERLNAGIVLFTPEGPLVSISKDKVRFRALHPDFSALSTDGWAEGLQHALQSMRLSLDQQLALLPMCAHPFKPDSAVGSANLNLDDPRETLDMLTKWLVDSPDRTLPAARAEKKKRPTKLQAEIAIWLKSAKLLSSKVEDLSKGRVVLNYPIDPSADLYTDFAVKNGELHVIETLDLRGVDHLTPSLRGDAAIKGVTLDEAREKVKGKRLAVFSASDYAVSKPAIWMFSRSADELWDMHDEKDRRKLADFISGALHTDAIPGLSFSS